MQSDARIGKYQTYLNYIREVGEGQGFVVADDVLRIPSTKNRWEEGGRGVLFSQVCCSRARGLRS